MDGLDGKYHRIDQSFFAIVIGLYFWNLLRAQQGTKVAVDREAKKEMEKLQRLRSISLTEPLSEKTRPTKFEEIIGQEDGLKALRAALCGPNPQHILLYGPPGVGKTAAARVVLAEAIKNPLSPLKSHAKFVELDATTARFDERGIADPLIGSVHDPIYQGAGPLGMAGIPQPKPGAVTKAHGGILFIDEIGELHPVQMNKLLKVLEDRKVFLESAYYSSEDPNIPSHIHDIFRNGLPADFRLIGATTRMPHEIPPAIRSRCVEIFFRALTPEEIKIIVLNAVKKIEFELEEGAIDVIVKFATNGRDGVNMVQIAAGLALTEGRKVIRRKDIEWVVNSGQYAPRPDKRVPSTPQVGYANGLAVHGPNLGVLVELEVAAIPVYNGKGRVITTGVVDEEEMGEYGRTIRRKSTARGSVENVLTILKKYFNLDCDQYDLHINFPGGIPLDGPSAGITLVTAIYSAITGIPVDNLVAMTGEVSILGHVMPVGGIIPKVKAAKQAGAKRVIIPADNWQDTFADETTIQVFPVRRIEEVIAAALIQEEKKELLGQELREDLPFAPMPKAPLGSCLS
ncbi:MAG: ATP-dependent protease LonB [Firmicutes bacterium]|nr:ATP-dependent protease LonB [Bacillota bacterium]